MDMKYEYKIEIIKILLECAKIRMQEVSHLSVGNYVEDNYKIILLALRVE